MGLFDNNPAFADPMTMQSLLARLGPIAMQQMPPAGAGFPSQMPPRAAPVSGGPMVTPGLERDFYAQQPPAQSQAEPPGPGLLDRLGTGLSGLYNAAPMLMAMGGATMRGGLGAGLQAGAGPMAQLQAQNMQRSTLAATYQALIAKGVPPAEAQAAALNPEILKTVASKYFEAAKPSIVEIGRDRYGQPVHGVADMAKYQSMVAQGKSPDEAMRASITPIGGAGFAGALAAPGSPADGGVTGDAFLATLDAPRAATIKAIVEGREAPPTGMALKTPYFQQLMQDVAQYEPGFDLTRWQQRAATRKEFSAGGPNSPAGAITAGNTAIQHLGHLSDAAEALGNRSIPLWNSIANTFETQTGDPRVTNFEAVRNKYVEEATKFYRGTGGSEADLKRDIDNLSTASSPQQLREAINQHVQLMQSKINALQDRWRQGMGPNAGDFPIIQAESQKALDRIAQRASGQQAPQTSAAPQVGADGWTTLPNGVRIREKK